MFVQIFFLFTMGDSAATSPSIDGDSSSARVRRDDRWVGAEQPAAASSDGRAASQRWVAKVVGAEIPGGGKNKARKKASLGPYYAATKTDAEAKRALAIDDWLHRPVKKQKVQTFASDVEPSPNAEARPKRSAAPSELNALKESRLHVDHARGRAALPSSIACPIVSRTSIALGITAGS